MTENALSSVAALSYFYGARNDRIEDADTCAIPESLHDVLCVFRMYICACQKNTVDGELRIQHATRFADCSEQDVQSFRGEIGRMAGDDHAISCHQRIESHQSERGEAVDQNVIVFATNRVQDRFENELSIGERGQSGADPGQLMVAGDEVHSLPAVKNSVVRVDGAIHDDPIHKGSEREIEIIKIMFPETYGQATLRVCIYQQNLFASAGETDAEVQDGSRFTDAALLVNHRDDFFMFHNSFLSFRLMFSCKMRSFFEGCTDDLETVLLWFEMRIIRSQPPYAMGSHQTPDWFRFMGISPPLGSPPAP